MDDGANGLMPVSIAARREIAEGIYCFELREPSGTDLPPFTPGSHVEVRVPNGLMRKYSLCNDASERERYVLAVKREQEGRGGSVSLIDETERGGKLFISQPKNDFPLVESRGGYVFIAGGIGITPIISMIRNVKTAGWPFSLYYCTRSPEATAFAAELTAPEYRTHTKIHHDAGDPANALDLWPILEKPKGQHIYCCGPRSLMDAVQDMTGHWPAPAVHFESFADSAPVSANDNDFLVRVAGSSAAIPVPAGTTILQALRAAGYEVSSSCESGTCGTCRTRLLGGEPDHRDFVLPEADRESFIMICVSRARSAELSIALK